MGSTSRLWCFFKAFFEVTRVVSQVQNSDFRVPLSIQLAIAWILYRQSLSLIWTRSIANPNPSRQKAHQRKGGRVELTGRLLRTRPMLCASRSNPLREDRELKKSVTTHRNSEKVTRKTHEIAEHPAPRKSSQWSTRAPASGAKSALLDLFLRPTIIPLNHGRVSATVRSSHVSQPTQNESYTSGAKGGARAQKRNKGAQDDRAWKALNSKSPHSRQLEPTAVAAYDCVRRGALTQLNLLAN